MKDLSGRIAALDPGKRELLLKRLQNQAGERARAPEIPEAAPSSPPVARFDVVVLGGGLAGQTLARQIKRARPSISVLVTELRPHPVPESAHKVGESTVEIGSHYFSEVLDLKHHLTSAQLRKAGLRYFFSSGNNEDVASRVEMGASYFPPVPSYQLDRGRFENTLRAENVELGVEFWDRVKAGKVTRQGDTHHIVMERGGSPVTVACRWVVDASGRASLLKRQLGLARESGHKCNAVWFRLAARIDPDEWSHAPEWEARLPQGLRWLSTNHFMGRGYWVWFIPLAPDATSVGIVCDAEMHPLSEMKSFELALDWIRRHEPRCAQAVEEHRDSLMDFIALKHYAYGCTRVYSGDRWALTGEAGVFTDPFYSPGSDFIGMSNTYITDLILRDMNGESISARAAEYDRIYLNTYESFITVYENQYRLMGNPWVMAPKIVWDFAIYWGFLTLQFLSGRLCDLELQAQSGQILQRVNHLNARVQAFFRQWDALDRRECEERFIDVLGVDIMHRLHYELQDDLSGNALLARFSQNLKLMESLAAAMFHEAAQLLPNPPNRPVNPYAISLDPARWEADELFRVGKTVEVEEVAAGTMRQLRLVPATNQSRVVGVAHAG
jgi:flavin-dependent dehydrogenase